MTDSVTGAPNKTADKWKSRLTDNNNAGHLARPIALINAHPINENAVVSASSLLLAVAQHHRLHQRTLLPNLPCYTFVLRLSLCCDDIVRHTQTAASAPEDPRAPSPFVLSVSAALYRGES